MSFLQPWMLAALPLMLLPVIIHLINQRRYQSTPWAAMMFLLTATRMSRGYARLRQWVILLLRTAVIAALILAVSRPLSSGWWGLAGGSRPDTTLILLDRSPSMQQRVLGGEVTKLSAAVEQLVQTLAAIGSTHWAVIDSTAAPAQELRSIEALAHLAAAGPASSSAHLPAMLAAARDYIDTHRPGRTDIWIASDLRSHDWDPQSAHWPALRQAFQDLPPGIRFHLLAFPQPAAENVAIRVTQCKRVETGGGAELWLSLRLSRSGESDQRVTLPVAIEIAGVRSVVPVELVGAETELRDHRIELPAGEHRGWGSVSIAADANPADNVAYFVYDRSPPRHSVIVAQSPAVADLLEVAATVSPDRQTTATAQRAEPAQVPAVAWETVALLLWQGPLPQGDAAVEVEAFLRRGGQAIFFPAFPAAEQEKKFLEVRWAPSVTDTSPQRISRWRGDQDLLQHTASGAALPVGEIEIHQRSSLIGELTPLASLADGQTLIGRVDHGRGAAYFCGTTPAGADSSLGRDAVVFYVMLQRALAAGTAALGDTHHLIAGRPGGGERGLESLGPRATNPRATNPNAMSANAASGDAGQRAGASGQAATVWQPLATAADALSTQYPHQAGVYAEGQRLLAVNRAPQEDDPATVAGERLEELFAGLDFTRIDSQVGRSTALVQEVWRPLVIAMIAAMLCEAGLSMPRRWRGGGAER